MTEWPSVPDLTRVFEKVYVGLELPSTDNEVSRIRVKAEEPIVEDYPIDSPPPDYKYVLEVEVECENGHKNWIGIGTDAGDYRCTTCTVWL
jgi:hypothetical protein